MNKSIEVYAHRGGAGLAPENTLPAYKMALAIGVNVLDVDVGVTKDNIIVASHDRILNPAYTSYSNGGKLKKSNLLIHNFTFEELQQFEVGILNKDSGYGKIYPDQYPISGTKIPSLQQLIQYGKKIAGQKIRFQIELKTHPNHPKDTVTPEKFAELIGKLIAQEKVYAQTEVHSFDWRNLLALQRIDKRIFTSYVTSKREEVRVIRKKIWFAGYDVKKFGNSFPRLIKELGGKGWCPDYRDLTFKKIIEAHKYGLRVVPWTVDKVSDMHRLIDMKVDGIITNRPDILRGVLAVRGYSLPISMISNNTNT